MIFSQTIFERSLALIEALWFEHSIQMAWILMALFVVNVMRCTDRKTMVHSEVRIMLTF